MCDGQSCSSCSLQARIGDKCRRPEESECEPGECCQTPGIPHYVHTRELLASLHPFYIEGDVVLESDVVLEGDVILESDVFLEGDMVL